MVVPSSSKIQGVKMDLTSLIPTKLTEAFFPKDLYNALSHRLEHIANIKERKKGISIQKKMSLIISLFIPSSH